MRIIVGITGLSGTGKDTVAEILTCLAQAQGMYVLRYRLSDEAREELIQRGRADEIGTRKALIDICNELRAKYGGGELARRVMARVANVDHSVLPANGLVVVVGIRHPGEVEFLRQESDPPCVLLAVEALLETRSSRCTSRGQYEEDVMPSEAVQEADEAIGISTCIQMADWLIVNEGSIEELASVVGDLFRYQIAPLCSIGNAGL